MSDQPDPVGQNIIDWCQEDNIQSSGGAETTQIVWSRHIGTRGISVYKLTRFSDRIYFQSTINFSEIHRTLVNQTWNESKRGVMMFNLKKLVAQLDILINFRLNNDELTGFHTYKIHYHSTISKADFIEKYLRIQSVHDIVLNQLNLELGEALQSERQNQDSGNRDTGR